MTRMSAWRTTSLKAWSRACSWPARLWFADK
jgi:hypothetical protein